MKSLLFSAFLILSFNSFSQEKYICSLDLSPYGQSGFEVKTYERTGNYFKKTTDSGNVYYFNILEDNESFLTLVEATSNYPTVFVTFIDKKNNTFFEYYLNPEHMDEKERSKRTGTFIRTY